MRFFGLLLLTASGICAQTAELSGFVTDPQQSNIPAAALEIRSVDTGATHRAIANEAGLYTISALKPGVYSITVQAPGFRTASRENVVLEVGQKARLDFVLQVGQVSEVVTVSADTLLLNTSDAAISTVVSRKFVENIPLNGRSLQSLITLSPGVVIAKPPYGSRGDSGEFSVNGQRTEANYFTVDGASGNFGVGSNTFYGASATGGTPSSSALGTTQGLISLDALQEFRIQTSSYAAEFGRSPGAQVSLTSRSGTNEFHGTLFDYFRNDKLDANNWFNNRSGIPKTATRQNDFGGTLGGPVFFPGYSGRNRTFFFFSYEGLRLRVPQGSRTVQVPELDLRRRVAAPLQTVLSAFPAPNDGPVLLPDASGVLQPTGLGYFTKAVSDPAVLDNVSIRMDQRFSDRFNIFGRFQNSPSRLDGTTSLIHVSTAQSKSRVFYLGGDWMVSPRMVNQTRFNASWSDRISENVSEKHNLDGTPTGKSYSFEDYFTEPYPEYSQAGVSLRWGGNPSISLLKNGGPQTQWNLVDTLSWTVGKHSLKFGGDYRETTNIRRVREISVSYQYNSVDSLLRNVAETLSVSADGFGQKPKFKNLSFFAQDEWRVSPALTLTLGLRWDINPAPRNTVGAQAPVLSDVNTFTMAPQGTPLFATDYLGLGPRIGLTYSLFRKPSWEMVLRTGYGLFFDTGNTQTGRAFIYAGFRNSLTASNVSFPLPSQYYARPKPTSVPPFDGYFLALNPNLKLPYSDHWNLTIEQRLGSGRSFTAAYVGSAGHRLHDSTTRSTPQSFNGGTSLGYIDNIAFSDYHSMQLKFQQAVWRGLQVLNSYTWSHSIDNSSSDYDYSYALRKGDSDFDQRHVFQSAITYDIPRFYGHRVARAIVDGWGIDARISINTSSPVEPTLGTIILPNGESQNLRPDVVPGQPFYVYGPQFPGGRALNYSAFRRPADTSSNGNVPRNILRGFGSSQTNMALRRSFRLTERAQVQFRAEGFNVFNQPSFGTLQLNWASGPQTFGMATATLNSQLGSGLNALYQIGGPRSLQLALKLTF